MNTSYERASNHERPQDTISIEIDIDNVAGVHTGGMVMDNDEPSYDVYEKPFVILHDGSKLYISEESALQIQSATSRRYDDDD